MEQDHFNPENPENQAEEEKSKLAETSEEVLDLLEEQSGPLTEKAKVILAKIAKVAAIGVAAVGGIAALGLTAAEVGEIAAEVTKNMESGVRITGNDLVALRGMVMDVALVTFLAGALSAVGLKRVIENLKPKSTDKSAETQN